MAKSQWANKAPMANDQVRMANGQIPMTNKAPITNDQGGDAPAQIKANSAVWVRE